MKAPARPAPRSRCCSPQPFPMQSICTPSRELEPGPPPSTGFAPCHVRQGKDLCKALEQKSRGHPCTSPWPGQTCTTAYDHDLRNGSLLPTLHQLPPSHRPAGLFVATRKWRSRLMQRCQDFSPYGTCCKALFKIISPASSGDLPRSITFSSGNDQVCAAARAIRASAQRVSHITYSYTNTYKNCVASTANMSRAILTYLLLSSIIHIHILVLN